LAGPVISVKGIRNVAEGKRVSDCLAGETVFRTHPTVHVLTTPARASCGYSHQLDGCTAVTNASS
jgi:hypothetical protein